MYIPLVDNLTVSPERSPDPKAGCNSQFSAIEHSSGVSILTRLESRVQHQQASSKRAATGGASALIGLAAAQRQANVQIARELDINVDTVRLWRDRWARLQMVGLKTLPVETRLQDEPRPCIVPRITMELRCQIAALACEAPSKAGRPISQWTGREIADKVMARGIVEQISSRHAARLLKKAAFNKVDTSCGNIRWDVD